MSNSRTRRTLYRLASTSVMASVLTALPVSIELQGHEAARSATQPPPIAGHLGRPAAASSKASEVAVGVVDPVEAARRDALARLGLDEKTAYQMPVLLTLSQARASPGGGGGDGGGNSGSGGGSGGGSGSGSGGGSGGSGGSAGGSDASGSATGQSNTPWDTGVSGASFGDIEQEGPDLSEDEEAAAIETGWQ